MMSVFRLRRLFCGMAICLVWSTTGNIGAGERSIATTPVSSRKATPEEEPPLHMPPVELAPEATDPEEATSPTTAVPSSGEVVELRLPESTTDTAAEPLKDAVEPSWLNDVIDENSTLWRENSDVLEIIPNSSGFGLTSLGFTALHKSENTPGVWVVPRFNWTFVSGPTTPAVQAQLFDLRLEMNFAQPINDVWTVHLQLAPAFVTDWNNKSRDAFRLIGGGMLAAHVNDQLTVLGGVQALSRFDLPILPVGGVRWHPNSWMEVDATFPNPRLAWRYSSKDSQSEWLYVGGQLGGNQWAIDHGTSDHDRLGYRDYRVVIGWETRQRDGNRSLFELGYVFDRRLNFQRSAGDQHPGETVVIRWGSRF